ncbi:DUF3791 domain-containing protein [Clostridium carboxidivorans]|nr:DUF3791 domain-containing protein [Clostridium carboxidivorans]
MKYVIIFTDENTLEFTIFCIESLAERLKMSSKGIYKLINSVFI